MCHRIERPVSQRTVTPNDRRARWFSALGPALWALALCAPPAAGDVVGDANGDGVFDNADLSYAETSLRFGWNRPNPLADVALPCNGVLEPTDGQRILGALMAARNGLSIRSRCHEQAIGEAIVPPPPPPPPLITLDDLLVEIAEVVPEFCGLYVEEQDLTVVLTDPSAEIVEQAVIEIYSVFGEERFADLGVRVSTGQYTFSQLAEWKEAAGLLIGQTAVTMIDANERTNRLTVGLDDLEARRDVEAELESLGVPPEAVTFEQRSPFQPSNHLLDGLRSKIRPLRGGLVIESDDGSACSLGFLAKRNGQRGFVTNSHCLSPIGMNAGRTVFQEAFDFDPNTTVSLVDQVGAELVDPPLVGGNTRASDAAFVLIDADETGYLGWVAGTPGNGVFFNQFTLVGKKQSLCGDFVLRVGARSGQVGGTVTETCADVQANWSADVGSPNIGNLTCQTLYSAPSQNGDSGSPVFDLINGSISQAELVGIHWGSGGGKAIMSPIANIEAEFGVLDVHVQNEPPDIEILVPADGASVGSGSFVTAHLEASVFDFEGASTVEWSSVVDGGLLGTGTVANGIASLDALLGGGPGYRVITALATDNFNNSDFDAVIVSVDNSPPQVWIDWPGSGAALFAGVPYQLHGSSLDPESFQPLPCSDLDWSVIFGPSPSSFPTNGCHPTVTFDSTGVHVIQLEGEDGGGAGATTSVVITVVTPPPGAPPVITFQTPGPGALLDPEVAVTVSAIVTDPGSAAPVDIEWIIESPYLIAPGTSATLQIGSVASGGTTSVTFTPESQIKFGCGSRPLTMRLQATDADNNTSEATLELGVMFPTC